MILRITSIESWIAHLDSEFAAQTLSAASKSNKYAVDCVSKRICTTSVVERMREHVDASSGVGEYSRDRMPYMTTC